MDKLPNEILLMVFELLPANEVWAGVAKVCQRWAHVSRRRALCINNPRHLKRLRHRPRAILVAIGLPDPNILFRKLVVHVPCLQELSIYVELPLDDNDLRNLARLTHLRHLDVFVYSRCLNSSIIPVARHLRSLVINETVAPGVLRTLADCPRLHSLHMYGRSLCYPRLDLTYLLRVRSSQLTELTLRCTELKDSTYEAISYCSNLKTLQLYSCWLMTKTGAMYLTRLKQLRYLHITGARMVRNNCLAEFIMRLPIHIEELVLSASWFSDEHIPILIEQLPRLRMIELWRCQATANGLVQLVNLLPHLEQFDTDMLLRFEVLDSLKSHPSLLRVRCRMDPDSAATQSDRGNQPDRGKGKPTVLAADAMYTYNVLRDDGEGYHADLFYYWTQRVPLENVQINISSYGLPFT